ncbi:hypothetical protein V7S43_005300 [Phytophthora oleae]|uniref:C3H1-type domain-containing protein n=1 Tax=Phytophthora oleae TaxID=2107226 RepID=A0ABD3FW82_9STRA
MVFRTVHDDAVNNVPHAAPPQVINAMCNLYQAAFGELFDDILHHVPSRDLNSRAQRVLRRDSSAYQQYVALVLNDAVVHTVLRGPPSEPREAQRQAHSCPRSRRQPYQSGRSDQPSIIPAATRTQIPMVNGAQVCIRYQVERDCTFPRCHHTHALHRLPPDVLQWVVNRHGPYKREHPQHE